ncbi:two-component hybrid sensor and regulator [Leptolyngbya sp. NIES-2104]|nr:two-component hybrid sensor and regulator [Leptolyngbya sp. NIES-2104]
MSWIESGWFSTIAQQSTDLIGAISIEGDWLCLNPSGREILSFTETLPFAAMLSESMQQLWNQTVLPQLLECGHWRGQFSMLRDSEPMWFESQWFLLRDPFSNQPLGFATMSRNIEPPAPESDSAEKTRFLADAAHELKSPLAVMATSIDLLDHEQLSIERKQKHFRRLRSKVQQMGQLLDDILVLSRGEQAAPVMSEIDPVQACAECVEEAQMSSDRHEIRLIADQSLIVTDANLLQRILVNLLSNSIKYSPAGGKIECRLSIKPHQFTLTVQDSGIGIPIAEQSRLFQSFYRASNTAQIAGTGLGLAIVKQCVDRLNGQITVESALQVGTTFTIEIPLQK